MKQSKSVAKLSVGIARRCITPPRPVFQSGYERSAKSEGIYQQLHARALVLEDAKRDRIAILTAELLDFSQPLVDTIKAGVKKRLGLDESQMLLSASHTHCGPVVDDQISHLYPEVDMEYVRWLGQTCIDTICDAAQELKPVTAQFATGVAVFGINRRRPDLPDCPMLPNPSGRCDPEVAILKLAQPGGDPVAILFSYACHPTVMGGQIIGGDYPGHAQLQLEMEFPGANAMFLAGCFGDVRPRMINAKGSFSSGSVDDVRAMGRELSLAVIAGLTGTVRDVTGPLLHRIETVQLPYQKPLTRAEFKKVVKRDQGYEGKWAKAMLARLKKDGKLPTSRPATVQVLGIGPFRLVAFNDEMCVGYQLKVKKGLAPAPALVAGYCGCLRSYVPTADLIPQGGYEVRTNIHLYLEPAPLALKTEKILISTALRLAGAKRGNI
ncbi:MAG: neutral/alkaline non-lysosomal ceramidase N-terminal domain-containing protein [Kiritimatiellaeota bacterium]|nr:neutral/alkaline non-lysosomal ceramidase N-terminal domain-containing protein [Kiritimatiellota bacterium]